MEYEGNTANIKGEYQILTKNIWIHQRKPQYIYYYIQFKHKNLTKNVSHISKQILFLILDRCALHILESA